MNDDARPLTILQQALPGRLITDPQRVAAFSSDASRARALGLPAAVVVPRSAAEVAVALRWADEHRVPVSVRGAGTGLAGGAVGYPDGLVISLAALDAITGIDPDNRLIEVQAGVVTADIDAAAARHGLMYAPDPASSRESTIGGNIATNAGGLRCVKYGVTAEAVAGLEVVLANGEVLHTGARTRKNAVGYNLTGLFVGSEGTLGVVTAATLRLVPRPAGTAVSFRASFSSLEAAGAGVAAVMSSRVVPEVLELMDRLSVLAVERFAATGIDTEGVAAVLIGQLIGPDALAEAELVGTALRGAGAVSVEHREQDQLLEARRRTGPALSAQGLRVSCDVGVPVSRLAEIFAAIERIGAEERVQIPTFAHAGDGNLHPSVIIGDDPSEQARADAERILDRIVEAALDLGGTASGEHGVGSLKLGALTRQLEPTARAVQLQIKRALDPHGILTPGRAVA